jgi:threonine dehydrogenase-like Zn-dependent dehydrogenase
VTSFRAQELHSNGSFHTTSFRIAGSTSQGFVLERQGALLLELPPGYALRKSRCCGICSTDQARPFLPFPLPQIIGHEVLVEEGGRLAAVEINASHAAIGSPAATGCPLCAGGLPTHCPDRLVLGIDRLPGGFGPWILAPVGNIVPVPTGMPPDTAVLVEPFAAALHAAETVDLQGAERVAVLGAGRLGLLITAALGAVRSRHRLSFSITVIETNRARADLALRLGADSRETGTFDIVIEATGTPEGLGQALGLATREVHVKSTTGRKTLGLRHLTEMVVDEVSLAPCTDRELDRLVAGGARSVLLRGSPISPDLVSALTRRGLAPEQLDGEGVAPGADAVVVTSLEEADRTLRPRPGREAGLVRPRGTILVDRKAPPTGLLAPLFERGLRITTSRCGDLHRAFRVLEQLGSEGVDLGQLLVTHHLPASDMNAAMTAALQPGAIKVVVDHG